MPTSRLVRVGLSGLPFGLKTFLAAVGVRVDFDLCIGAGLLGDGDPEPA